LNMVITTTDQNIISHMGIMVVVMSGIIINRSCPLIAIIHCLLPPTC
jgi:hypothetical protein